MAQEKAKKKGSDRKISAIIFLTVLLLLVSLTGCKKPSETPPVKVESTVALYVSMEENPPELQTSLSVRGMDALKDTTLANIPTTLTQGIGDKSDREKHTYFAFSFYLFNQSDCDISYELTVNLGARTGSMLNAIRIMVIEGDNPLSQGTVYAKEEASEEGRARLEQYTDYKTTPFVSDSVACKRSAGGFKQGTRVKQTLLIWIEGWDIDCTDQILSNKLTMSVNVTAKEDK